MLKKTYSTYRNTYIPRICNDWLMDLLYFSIDPKYVKAIAVIICTKRVEWADKVI